MLLQDLAQPHCAKLVVASFLTVLLANEEVGEVYRSFADGLITRPEFEPKLVALLGNLAQGSAKAEGSALFDGHKIPEERFVWFPWLLGETLSEFGLADVDCNEFLLRFKEFERDLFVPGKSPGFIDALHRQRLQRALWQ